MSDVQGKQSNPFTHAPSDWHEEGVPYGAFCKCCKCGYVGTSTVSFDYRAKSVGDALECDQCQGLSTHATEKVLRPEAIKAFEEDLADEAAP